MRYKFMILSFCFLLLINIVSAGIFDDCSIYGNCKPTSTGTGVISGANYSINVNNSDYLRGYSPTTLRSWMESHFNSVYVSLTDLIGMVGNWSADKVNYYTKTEVNTINTSQTNYINSNNQSLVNYILYVNTSMKNYVDSIGEAKWNANYSQFLLNNVSVTNSISANNLSMNNFINSANTTIYQILNNGSYFNVASSDTWIANYSSYYTKTDINNFNTSYLNTTNYSYIPYVEANQNVNLGNYNITSLMVNTSLISSTKIWNETVGGSYTYNWTINLTINNSLPAVTGGTPSIFYKDSSWYLISGNSAGTFSGFVLLANGSWIVNSTIIGGLPSLGSTYSSSSIFQKDGTWYLISGANTGTFYSYDWTGTTWEINLTMNASLPDIQDASTPTVFYKDSSWYLISGEYHANGFFGFVLLANGTWMRNSTITSGLGGGVLRNTPMAFQKDGTWYLINGNNGGTFQGYNWTGTSWQSDSKIVANLGDIGDFSHPFAFQKDGSWYLIVGTSAGKFYGFNYFGTLGGSSYVAHTLISNINYAVNNSGYSAWLIDDNLQPKITNNISFGGSLFRWLKGWFVDIDASGNILANGTINATGGFGVGSNSGITGNYTILKDVDLVGLTKTYCFMNFTGGILFSSTC